MIKSTIRHENLKKLISEIDTLEDTASDETFAMFRNELKHSCLITAGDIKSNTINLFTLKTDKGDFGMLFTDMDEFRKVFPNFEVEAHENTFAFYKLLIETSDLLGFVINFEGEQFVLVREIFEHINDLPMEYFPPDNAYSSEELKRIRQSTDNSSLEEFIANPSNAYDYEGLFESISNSTMFTLRLSSEDFSPIAEDGVISMRKTGPLGFLYKDVIGGEFAVAFTSEDKIKSIETTLNRYPQLVNFTEMVTFLLNSDMDGIIINPNEERIMISRDVLMEYYGFLEENCSDERLNSAIYHMFLMEE
jgi:hypothetical protein